MAKKKIADLFGESKKAEDKPQEETKPAYGLVDTLQVVCQMRHWQRQFFKDKNQQCLIEAKKLEQSVDMRLSALGIIPKE